MAQFPAADVKVILVPHVRRSEDVERAVHETGASGGILVHTLVNDELRRELVELAEAAGVTAIDLVGPLITRLSAALGQAPAGQPGLYRQQREAYFGRVEAIEFTVAHDDGQRLEELDRAEIVLVGVSRVGKTPLSIYLSVLGWKVANVPLIREQSPPPALFEVDRRRVVGLVIEPGQLIAHRQWRQRHRQWRHWRHPAELPLHRPGSDLGGDGGRAADLPAPRLRQCGHHRQADRGQRRRGDCARDAPAGDRCRLTRKPATATISVTPVAPPPGGQIDTAPAGDTRDKSPGYSGWPSPASSGAPRKHRPA